MTYDYRCMDCGKRLTRRESVSDHIRHPMRTCPDCGGAMAQTPSRISVRTSSKT